MRNLLRLSSCSLAVILLSATVGRIQGATVSGLLSTANTGQIVATAGWAQSRGGFKIAWEITGTGPFHYKYTISDAGDSTLEKGLSHIIIQVSPDFNAADISNPSPVIPKLRSPAAPEGTKTTWSSADGGSNPNMPGAIPGLKFDTATEAQKKFFVFEFDSPRVPVPGNFYAKNGKDGGIDVTAWNSGFDGSGTAFIMVPDSTFGPTVIPLPATVWMGALGLVAVVLMKHRRLARA